MRFHRQHDYHYSHYAVLVLGVVFFVVLFYLFRFIPSYQIITAGLGSFYYVCWGAFHHAYEGRLSAKILLEYVLVSLIAFGFALWATLI